MVQKFKGLLEKGSFRNLQKELAPSLGHCVLSSVFSIRRVGGDPCVPLWRHSGRPVGFDLFLPSLMADCAGHRREWTVCLT